MTASAIVLVPSEPRRLINTIGLAAAVLVAAGALSSETSEGLLAYVAITALAVIPAAIWVWTGAKGIPILPAVAAFHYIYYALPLLRHELVLNSYSPDEIARAGMTVTLYLAAATLTWAPFVLWRKNRAQSAPTSKRESRNYKLLIFFGLASGVAYYIGLFSGLLAGLGSLFGVVRSVMLTATLMACFMLGHSRAEGLLRGTNWTLAISAMGVIVICAISTLFLISGVIYCAAAIFGFVITRKQVPWKFLIAAASVVMVLHAGKAEIREKYWPANMEITLSIVEIPGLLSDWVETGLTKLLSGAIYNSAVDRASLIQMLLHAQRLSPSPIPYLDGATYSELPNILIPRFLNENKQVSQFGMSMLNVRYGLQTEAGTARTAVGWGLIAESFANFGYLGVIGIGILLGYISGVFQRISAGAAVISLPTLFAIIVLLQLINLELDASSLVSSMAQSLVAVWIFFSLYRMVARRRSRALERRRTSAISGPPIAQDITSG